MLKRTCFSVVTRQGATLAPAKTLFIYVPLQKFSFLFNLLFLANEKNKVNTISIYFNSNKMNNMNTNPIDFGTNKKNKLKTTPTHFGTNKTNTVQDNRLGLRFHDF